MKNPSFASALGLKVGFLAFALVGGACGRIVIPGSPSGAGGGTPGTSVTVSGITATTTGGFTKADPDAGSSQAHPPVGTWSMIVQYGPVGQAVQPTIPMQAELRGDGSAYAWVCAGAPDDGTLSKVCAEPSRTHCLLGSFAWDGVRWRADFPANHIGGTPNQGDIAPDGSGNILISYINPTYSGALFKWIDVASSGNPSCQP